jgi:MFS family permease
MSNEEVGKKVGVWPRGTGWVWGMTISTWAIWLMCSFNFGVVWALGPLLIDRWYLTPAAWAFFLAVMQWTRGVFGVPGAAISDRIGSGYKRKYFWGAMVVFYTIVSLLTAFRTISMTFIRFILVRCGVQIGCGVEETVRPSVVAEVWPDEHRGFALGLTHTGFPFGVLLAGLLVSWTLGRFGSDNWRYVFYFTLISFVPLLWYYLISTKGAYEKAYAEFDRKGLTKPSLAREVSEVSGAQLVLRTLKIKNIQSSAINAGLFMGVISMFMAFYPKYLSEIHGFNYAQVAALAVAWSITGAIFQVLLPWWSDRLGRKPVLTLAAIWMGLIMIALPFATTLLLVILVQIAYGFVINAVYPILYAVGAESAEKGGVATAVSIVALVLFLGGGGFPLLVSPLIQVFGGWGVERGYIWIFGIMAALCFIAAAIQHWRTTETAVLAKK